ncbi:amidase, partial [Lecanoromycetidae sp. Uapishka_2]
MIDEFFTTPDNLDSLIEPVAIIVGISAALSAGLPEFAVVAGAGSIANGMFTQLGLQNISPLQQWSEISGAFSTFTNQTVQYLQDYWTSMLNSPPQTLSNGVAYDQNPIALNAVFRGGGFAQKIEPAWAPPALCGALYSPGINALWNADHVFIVKISDTTLGQGAGAACEGTAQKGLLVCDPNGVEAYIFIRWVFANQGTAGGDPCVGCTVGPANNLDKFSWEVQGAYATPPDGNSDSNQLVSYGLDLLTIALSAIRVQAALGFWATDTVSELQQTVTSSTKDLTTDQTQAWNLAVCDMDAIANGRHLDPTLKWQSIRDRKLTDIASRIPPEWQISPSKVPSPRTANVLSVPKTCGILTPKEVNITEDYDARSLVKEIRERRFTSVEVAKACCKRAAICHQLTNCLTEPLFSSALARAAFLDEHLARTGQPIGPLHGLPISVKDTFHVEGIDSSIGIASLCFKPAKKNAPLVQLLLDAGAVIHCKTNVPQTLMALDSVNNIFGRTLNPENRQDWTAGGSSGGEGVLVKMRGSVMGVGTDVGGSIRIPAACNGIIGFKPSLGRIPVGGQESGQLAAAGKVGLESCAGPIARSLDDIALFMGAVEAATMWEIEAGIVPGRWWSGSDGLDAKNQRPVIGLVWRDGVVEPLPPIKKVLAEIKEKLKVRGVEVVDIDAKRFRDCQSLANKFFSAEGGNHMLDIISETDEPLIPWLASRLKRKHPATVDRLRDLNAQRMQLQDDFLAIWKTADGRPIDAFICPVAPHPIPPPDRWNSVGYTSSLVLLDYPAAALPVRALEQDDLNEEIDAEILGPWDKANRELWNKETIDRNSYLNSPLSVQVVGQRLQERRLWNAMQVIEAAIKDTPEPAKAKL